MDLRTMAECVVACYPSFTLSAEDVLRALWVEMEPDGLVSVVLPVGWLALRLGMDVAFVANDLPLRLRARFGVGRN